MAEKIKVGDRVYQYSSRSSVPIGYVTIDRVTDKSGFSGTTRFNIQMGSFGLSLGRVYKYGDRYSSWRIGTDEIKAQYDDFVERRDLFSKIGDLDIRKLPTDQLRAIHAILHPLQGENG